MDALLPITIYLFAPLFLFWWFFARDGALIDKWIRKLTDYTPAQKHEMLLKDIDMIKEHLQEYERRQKERKEGNIRGKKYNFKEKMVALHKNMGAEWMSEGEDCIDCGDPFQREDRCITCSTVVYFKEQIRWKEEEIRKLGYAL